MNLSDLSTLGPVNFEGKLKSRFTAHPKIDATTGTTRTAWHGGSALQDLLLMADIMQELLYAKIQIKTNRT